MTDTRIFTPAEWEAIDGIRILDPDGWRWDNKSFDDPIDWHEWNSRMMISTIQSTRSNSQKEMVIRMPVSEDETWFDGCSWRDRDGRIPLRTNDDGGEIIRD